MAYDSYFRLLFPYIIRRCRLTQFLSIFKVRSLRLRKWQLCHLWHRRISFICLTWCLHMLPVDYLMLLF